MAHTSKEDKNEVITPIDTPEFIMAKAKSKPQPASKAKANTKTPAPAPVKSGAAAQQRKDLFSVKGFDKATLREWYQLQHLGRRWDEKAAN